MKDLAVAEAILLSSVRRAKSISLDGEDGNEELSQVTIFSAELWASVISTADT